MKIFKFYKNNCAPCYTTGRMMRMINFPENIEIIELNVEEEENRVFAKSHGINTVPTLMTESGKIFKMGKETKKQDILDFINGYVQSNF